MKKLFGFMVMLCTLCSTGLFAEQKIVLKIASVAPANSPWDVELRKLAAEWNRITDGTVSIRFQNMTTIGGEKAGIQRMQSPRPGQKAPLDGCIFTTLGLNDICPTAKIFTLSCPFLIRSQAELDAVIKNFGGEIEAEYEKHGLKMIAWTNAGWIRFYTKDSYSTLAGLKKQKIASSTGNSAALTNALKIAGFSVADVPATKFSQMLRAGGTFKGFYSVPLATYITGDYKSINYGLDTRLCPVMCGWVISAESWNQIPAKYHAALKASVQKTVDALNAELEDFDVDYTNRMVKGGLKIIKQTPEEVNAWDIELNNDMKRVGATNPEMFDMVLYNKIKNLLEKMRK